MLNKKLTTITNATQGLGRWINTTLAHEEYILLMVDVQANKINAAHKKITDTGCRAVAYKLDLCNVEKISDFLEFTAAEYCRVDVLIHNNAIDITLPITELSVVHWDKVINTNLRAVFIMSKFVLTLVVKRGSEYIINIVTTLALRCWAEAPASHEGKWGLCGFSQVRFTEAGSVHIKMFSIIKEGMQASFLLDRFSDPDPTKLQEPQNVADIIRFILSHSTKTILLEIVALPLKEPSKQ